MIGSQSYSKLQYPTLYDQNSGSISAFSTTTCTLISPTCLSSPISALLAALHSATTYPCHLCFAIFLLPLPIRYVAEAAVDPSWSLCKASTMPTLKPFGCPAPHCQHYQQLPLLSPIALNWTLPSSSSLERTNSCLAQMQHEEQGSQDQLGAAEGGSATVQGSQKAEISEKVP